MMKLSALILVLLLSFAAHAQLGKTGFAFGLKAGGSLTAVKDNIDNLRYTPGLGYSAGLFARFKFLAFYIQPELNFGQQSYHSKIVVGSTSTTNDLSFQSFDIPVLMGFYLFKIRTLNIRLIAGPEASIITLYQVNETLSDPSIRIGYGAVNVGLGADIGRFTFDARYKHGLTSLSKLQNVDLNLQQVQLVAGFKIIHRGK